MKFSFNRCWVVWWLAVTLFGGLRAGAATSSVFGLTAFNSPNVVLTNAAVTTTIMVTNLNVGSSSYLTTTHVTNAFSGPVNVTNYSSDYNTNLNFSAVTSGNTVVFSFSDFTNGGEIHIVFNWMPLAVGPLTNFIEVASSDVTNTAATNLVINEVYGPTAALWVTNHPVSLAYVTNLWVITNDWVTYAVTVRNQGPDTAAGVMVTNTLPAGVVATPSAQGYTVSAGTNLVFNAGTLTNGASVTWQYTIQPAVNGAFTLTDAVVDPAGLYDPNSGNNFATNALFVTNYLNDSTLAALTNSGQTVNPQNGLIEQMVRVANAGSQPVQAVRLVVAGLTNQLYNASGTNSGQPFVTYPLSLAAGANVDLRLQFAPRLPFPFVNGQLQVYEVPATVLNYRPSPGTNFYLVYATNSLFFYRIQPVTGGMLLEFSNTVGSASSFTIIYSDNMGFNNAMIVPQAVSSSANRVQWLDYGPPATVSAPTTGTRYYKVRTNP